jgi:SPP1 family predicted phage head-tail adaptor
MTAPGDLNRRLVLLAPVETADGAGGVTVTYTTAAMLWAQVTPLTSKADVAADSLGGAVRYRIVVRRRGDVTTRHQFQDGARVYRVLTVNDIADRSFTDISAVERED